MGLPSAQTRRLRTALATHRDSVHTTLGKYGATNPRVFGSVAHGDARADSDLDLLVDLSKPLGLFTLARLERELSDILGVSVEVVPAESLRDHLRSSVLADADPL